MADQEKSNIKQEYNNATTGLNLDQTLNQIKKGALTYALNAQVENFDANSVNYQNEQGNELCVIFPGGFVLLKSHFISEKRKHIFFLTNPVTRDNQIGYMDNNDCQYHILVDDVCLGWDINYPIHKIIHRITNCSTELFWTDNIARRHLDIEDVPYKLREGSDLCDPLYTNEIDCNQLKVQPNFNIPDIDIVDITTGGDLKAGTYQFAAQYSDSLGNGYTAYYSVTNPTPIADLQITSVNFDYAVGKSIVVNISNLDVTGQFQYFNLAVIKTINNIASVELVGTYFIEENNKEITYTGQNVTNIRLSINDIFEKFPYYELADDITNVQDVLVWKGLTSIDRVNYQKIANQISLQWQSYKIPSTEDYSDELNATNLRGYLRDEVYPFEITFELKNGKITDGFHIPGRIMNSSELTHSAIPDTSPDFIGEPDTIDNYTGIGYSAYWKIYNTASVLGDAEGDDIGNATPYKYGDFAYWESTEEYPCNEELWGELAGQKIRHHKFPDVLVSPITESKTTFVDFLNMEMGDVAVFPIGVKIDVYQITHLIAISDLTQDQKDNIVGFKILRGDRSTNKSIVGKGILRNVGTYERQGQNYYYPNYPYNDLREDPFLNSKNNAWTALCEPYTITVYELTDEDENGIPCMRVQYTSCENNKVDVQPYYELGEASKKLCSLTKPVILSIGNKNTIYYKDVSDILATPYPKLNTIGTVGYANYDIWHIGVTDALASYTLNWQDPIYDGTAAVAQGGYITGVTTKYVRVRTDTIPIRIDGCCDDIRFHSSVTVDQCSVEEILPAITDPGYRQVFNSPETSFGQPFLGDVLKLENVMFGKGKGHFVEVNKNAKYKLLTEEAQRDALENSSELGKLTTPFNASAMFAAYQAYLTIYINGITRKNYAYSYNSIADYNYNKPVDNDGDKQRAIDFTKYLIPTVQSVADANGITINNYQRESSVFIKTEESKGELPFPSDSKNMVVAGDSILEDRSRLTIGESGVCSQPRKEQDISVVSYYASMKNTFVNQWGQIYSYITIDTGFHSILSDVPNATATVFGGDTFISRFGFKTKIPFFIDNRVGAPDDSDIFYDEIGNVAYPKYWHSARSILKDYSIDTVGILSNLISYKAHNFDCPNSQEPGPDSTPPVLAESNPNRTFYDGYFYLFAYGVPYFYCESSYNTELRQAFNDREGDFFPHVNTGIPDDWVQESYVSIANDNTYNYNVTYSKQNKENSFSHLPADWEKTCYTNYPFRAIYSDPQITDADNRVNSWLIYRALSYHDFPQNYGALTALDGIQNRAVLARFENKSLLYNNLLTIDTSNPQAAYVGNPKMFENPPIDYADTDLGYAGSQHKFLLKIPEGQITIDAKRGQVFLIRGTEAIDISAFGSGMNRFLTDHLGFNILKYFPNINIDNHANGIGLHGVYDAKFDRVLITKLDYVPLSDDVKYDYDLHEFYIEKTINDFVLRTRIYITDETYFCNKSWTLSFNFNTKSWISFHSYLPNFYIGDNNFFYSGTNTCCDDGLEAMVGEIIPYTTTSTTTIYYPPISSTSTSTTTIFIDCELGGGIFLEIDCELEGTGVITIPPPTTTSTSTLCARPYPLDEFVLYTGYVIGTTITPTIGSLSEACDGIDVWLAHSYTTMLSIEANAGSLDVGQVVYYGINEDGYDCTYVSDGWYFTNQSAFYGYAIHIEGGIITEITYCSTIVTTTTTTTILITADSNIISADNNIITGDNNG